MKRIGALALLLALAVLGCQDNARQQLEEQMMFMQERLVELETQVADSEQQAEGRAAAVSELGADVGDVEAEGIDLSAYVSRDLLVDVEATVGNVKTRLAEVRQRTDALNGVLRPLEPEE